MAAGTIGTRWPAASKPRPRARSAMTTPSAASPRAAPPARTRASTARTRRSGARRSVSRVPGAPPMTWTEAVNGASAVTTVTPDFRPASVALPTRSPATSVTRFRRPGLMSISPPRAAPVLPGCRGSAAGRCRGRAPQSRGAPPAGRGSPRGSPGCPRRDTGRAVAVPRRAVSPPPSRGRAPRRPGRRRRADARRRVAGWRNRRTRGGSRRQVGWLTSGEIGMGAADGEVPRVVPGRRPSYLGCKGAAAMRYVKWALIILLVVLVGSVLHYNLPQRDIVRIVNTEVRRVDPGVNAFFYSSASSGDAATAASRDVFFIETIRPNGSPLVYRNEDTGWGWPPYLKFNSANLQAIARDLESTQDEPRWVAVRHYGWRAEIL